jgi:hypothetical protein
MEPEVKFRLLLSKGFGNSAVSHILPGAGYSSELLTLSSGLSLSGCMTLKYGSISLILWFFTYKMEFF